MEQAIKTLSPLNRMPFTLAVALRLLVLIPIFGMSSLMIVTGIRETQQNTTSGMLTVIPGIFFFLVSLYLLIYLFFLKRRKLSQLQYLFYPDRLVIYNQVTNQIAHELSFDDFPSFTFHENLNNFGYIVIGKDEPIMAKGGAFNLKWGVNMKDPDIILENLPEVKKEYLFLKKLVENHQEKQNTFNWEFQQ